MRPALPSLSPVRRRVVQRNRLKPAFSFTRGSRAPARRGATYAQKHSRWSRRPGAPRGRQGAVVLRPWTTSTCVVLLAAARCLRASRWWSASAWCMAAPPPPSPALTEVVGRRPPVVVRRRKWQHAPTRPRTRCGAPGVLCAGVTRTTCTARSSRRSASEAPSPCRTSAGRPPPSPILSSLLAAVVSCVPAGGSSRVG